jgi:hypothetical protein
MKRHAAGLVLVLLLGLLGCGTTRVAVPNPASIKDANSSLNLAVSEFARPAMLDISEAFLRFSLARNGYVTTFVIPYEKLAKAEITTYPDHSAQLALHDAGGDSIASFLGKSEVTAQALVDALWAMKKPAAPPAESPAAPAAP